MNETNGPAKSGREPDSSEPAQAPDSEPCAEPNLGQTPKPDSAVREAESLGPAALRSRWVDYDTHELLTMISELEDERRWARFREGIWVAVLIHLILISTLTWIPRYVLKQPRVIDPFDAIKQRKDLTYLDMPPDALRKLQPKSTAKPVPKKPTIIDKKTLEAMKRETPPTPQPTAPTSTQPAQPVPPSTQPQLEAPHPAAVPARPNFATNSQNPADQLREAMKGAAHNRGQGGSTGGMGPSGPMRHPGAGAGGTEILSDTQGVDFDRLWIPRFKIETYRTWDPLIPDAVNPPISKKGMVVIRLKVLPNGRIIEGSMVLEGRSGDSALDRAAWGSLTGSNYPPLPKEFHGPYLEFRVIFTYNMEPR